MTNAACLAAALGLGHSQQQRSEEGLDLCFLLGHAILCMRPASSACPEENRLMVTCAANP